MVDIRSLLFISSLIKAPLLKTGGLPVSNVQDLWYPPGSLILSITYADHSFPFLVNSIKPGVRQWLVSNYS